MVKIPDQPAFRLHVQKPEGGRNEDTSRYFRINQKSILKGPLESPIHFPEK